MREFLGIWQGETIQWRDKKKKKGKKSKKR